MKKITVVTIGIIKALIHLWMVTGLIVVSALLYAATMRGVPGNISVDQGNKMTSLGMPFESSHERAPYALLLSIDENRSINLSQELANFGSPDVGFYQGKFFILFPPGISFLIYPLYELGKTVGYSLLFAYATIALFATATVALLYVISIDVFKLPRWAAMLVGLLFAFGTTSWSYAITIYQHIPTTFFVMLAFYAVWRYRQKGWLSIFWASLAWACYGIGIFIDFPSVFLGAPVMIYFVLSSVSLTPKHDAYNVSFRVLFAVTSIFFVGLIALHGYYNQLAFGDWKKFGQSFTRYEGEEKFAARLERQAQEATASGELQPKSSSASNPFSVFKEQKIVTGLQTLTIADDKGIFYYSPVLLFGVLAILIYHKKLRLEHGVLIAVAIVNVMVYASFSDPWGGWAYGPRYLIPAMSILSLFTVLFLVWFASWRKFGWIARIVFYPFFVFSSGIALLGVLTTNVIPPSVEGIYLGLPYNYVANIMYLLQGKTGNFLYTQFLHYDLSLSMYGAIIYGIVLAVVFFVLFIMPLFSKRYEH